MTGQSGRHLRFGLVALLVVGWAVAVWLMWGALDTGAPDPRLDGSPLATPTMRTFYAAALFSALELALILAILWPGRAEYYAARLGTCVLALATWLVMTPRSDAIGMDRVHRQWLSTMIVLLAGALLGTLLYRASARTRRRWEA